MPLLISGSSGFSTNGTNWSLMPLTNGGISSPNMPHCYVQKTNGGGWIGTSGATQTMVFDSALQNIGGYYNASTGLFTCPKTARYRVDISYLGGNGGYAFGYVAKNGVIQTGSFHINPNGSSLYAQIAGFWMGVCNASDTLSMQWASSSTANVYGAGHLSMMIIMVD